MSNLPTHIQRSSYAPNRAQRRRDKKLPPEVVRQVEDSERMVLRGPGKVGSPACNVVAIFQQCPENLMEALIHRYNQYNRLMAERERLKAHGWKGIKVSLAAAFQRLQYPLRRYRESTGDQ